MIAAVAVVDPLERIKSLVLDSVPSPLTRKMYGVALDRFLEWVTTKLIDGFVTKKREAGQEVTTINRQLEVLRRMLRLAVEWGAIEKQPCAVRMVPGAKHRDRVLSIEEERRYLAAAPLNLRHFATILLDTALRPEELFRLRFEDVRDGCVHVLSGKTRNARRVVPMSDSVREIVGSSTPGLAAATPRNRPSRRRTRRRAKILASRAGCSTLAATPASLAGRGRWTPTRSPTSLGTATSR